MSRFKDLLGMKFDRLLVISRAKLKVDLRKTEEEYERENEILR